MNRNEKMIIEVNNNYVSISMVQNYNNIISEIMKTLTVKSPGYFFSPAYKSGKWDGNKRFYWTNSGYFNCSIGLLHVIEGLLKKLSVKYEVLKRYAPREVDYNNLELNIELKPEQIETLYAMNRMGRGILQAPTGSGKTECAIAFAKEYLENNTGIVLFLTHRQSIFDQVWCKRIEERLGLPQMQTNYKNIKAYPFLEGKPEDNKTYMGNKVIYIAMSQTFTRHIKELKWLKHVKVVFCDEVHATETYKRKTISSNQVNIFRYLPNSFHTWGMSATPFKKEGSKIDLHNYYGTVQHFGDVLEIKSSNGIKTKVNVITVPYSHIPENYSNAVKNSIANIDKIQEIKKILQEMPDNKVLIFTKYIDHGNLMSSILGIPFISGETSSKERIETCRLLEDGKINAIIVSGIFYFGVDIPCIDTIIFAHIEKSYINIIQSIGRGNRQFQDKKVLIVFDFYDNDHSYLEHHSRIRLKHYKSMNYEVNMC
ncbi:DEAD/DEAH box helicase family protein [bacterium]|nr:DEAD/DEAH box helicase family protein [bacterium]